MDTKTASMIGNVIKILLAVAGLVLCFLIIKNSSSIEMGENHSYVSSSLTITYIAMGLCIGSAVLFGLFYFLGNISKSKGMLFSLIGFLAVAGISWAMADGGLTQDWINRGVTEQVSKLSSMGIYLTGILLFLALGLAVLSEVTKIFK